MRVRPARPRPRPAVLEAGSRQLSQRPHLFRSGAAEADHSQPSLCAEPAGLPAARPQREHLGLRPAVLGGRQGEQGLRAHGAPEHAALRPPFRPAPGGTPDRGPRHPGAGSRQGRRRQAPRPDPAGPLRPAGRPHQRADGDPPIPWPDRIVSATGARRSAERRHQDGASRAGRRLARRDRPGEEGHGACHADRGGGRSGRVLAPVQPGGPPVHGLPGGAGAALRRAVRTGGPARSGRFPAPRSDDGQTTKAGVAGQRTDGFRGSSTSSWPPRNICSR